MNPVLGQSLDHLESSELVRTVPESEITYQFKHALVQDTAQASLLLQERRRLHRLVAACLEAAYADRLDEIAVRLYQHYDAAGEARKTIEYAERAGDAASRKCAYAEAIIAYTRALSLVEKQPDDTERRIRLMTRLGRTYEEAFHYDAALGLYQQTRDQAQANGNYQLELAALVQIAKVYAVAAMRYDPEQSAQISQRALDLAHTLGDRHSESRIYWAMMLANVYGAKGARQGLVYGERSLELARDLDWREQMAYTLNDLAYAYMNTGNAEQAEASATEARALWRELDNKPMLTDNLNSSAMLCILRGALDGARTLSSESRSISLAIGNRWSEASSYMIDGYAAENSGKLAASLDAFRACRETGDSIGMLGLTVMARFEPARIHLYLGDVETGYAFAHDAMERILHQRVDWDEWALAVFAYAAEQAGDWKTADETVEKIKDEPPEFYFERMLPYGAVEIIYAQIRYELRHGQHANAKHRAMELLSRVRNSRFTVFEPVALEYLARVFLAQNEFDRARHALDEGQAIAESLGLLPAEIGLAHLNIALETARNNGSERAIAVQKTSDLIQKLMIHIPPELRSSFLMTPLGKTLQDA